jgi:hypothetical protein
MAGRFSRLGVFVLARAVDGVFVFAFLSCLMLLSCLILLLVGFFFRFIELGGGDRAGRWGWVPGCGGRVLLRRPVSLVGRLTFLG